jgi:hypothetical protein
MRQGCRLEDMPPHIYAAGQTAYRTLISTKKVSINAVQETLQNILVFIHLCFCNVPIPAE